MVAQILTFQNRGRKTHGIQSILPGRIPLWIRIVAVCLCPAVAHEGQESVRQSVKSKVEEHLRRGDYHAARRVVTEALRDRSGPIDLHHTGVLLTLLGDVDHLRGDFEAAGRSYRAAISSLERAGNAARLDLAWSQVNYAALLDIGGPSRDAARRRLFALEIYERELGPGDHETLIAKGELANGHLSRQEYGLAENLCREIIDTWEHSGFPPSAHLAKTWATLGFALVKSRKFRESAAAFQQSLALVQKLYGPNHPITLDARIGLALASAAQRQFALASEILAQADTIAAESLAPNDPTRIEILMERASVLRAQGLIAEAKMIERQLRTEAHTRQRTRPSVNWSELIRQK